ncbi:MAG: DUF6265 family protein [Saprospiraceae bacterium]
MQTRILILTLLLFSSCSQSSGPKSQLAPTTLVEDLNWMVGTWQVDEKEAYEEWKRVDRWLLGRSYKIKNKDTITVETMQITYREGELYYVPTVADQNNGQPVLFHLISGSPRQVVFENEAHDFPQRIGYKKKSAKHVEAWIEGVTKSGEEKRVVFQLRK